MFSIPKALIFYALFFWVVAGSALAWNSNRDASGLNHMVKPSVQRYGAKCDSNGTAGNGTDDSAAFLTAAARTANTGGFAVLGDCRIARTLTISAPITFGSTGALVVDSGKTVTINGAVTASNTQQVFRGAGTVVVATAPFVSVGWWGALTAADPAVAFRAAAGSNRTYVIPPASYTFQTVQARAIGGGTIVTNNSLTDPGCSANPCTSVPYSYVGAPAVMFRNLRNFTIEARAATFSVANGIAFSSIFHFDGDSNLTFQGSGGALVGNRSGLQPNQESSAITITSGVNFTFYDVTCSGNWGGISACFVGDWLVNGKIDRVTAPSVGICFDLAFMKQVTFNDFHCTGADASGGSGAGNKAWSNIYDNPAVNDNHTGVSFSDTDGVTVTNSSANNFITGAVINSGRNFQFSRNVWRDNLGQNPAEPGIGISISAGTVGHPPTNINIAGDKFINNGTEQRGYGVFVTSATADTISELTLKNVIFNNNASVGIDSDTPTKVSKVFIEGNPCPGLNQTTCISSNIATEFR
jgi:hypothetical protein